jgi:hypothetical protein
MTAYLPWHVGHSVTQEDPQPPQPPQITRQIRVAPLQKVGVPLLLLVPLLAILGLFDESLTTVSASNSHLSIQVEHVTRTRNGQHNPISIRITNLSSQSPVTATVYIDRAYLDHFSDRQFTPQATRLTDTVYEVVLPDLQARETRAIAVESQVEDPGWHTGIISATVSGGEPVQVTVRTFIFP